MYTTNKLIRREAVLNKLSISKSSLYRKISAGLWPEPIQLSARAVGWLEGEVLEMTAAIVAGKPESEQRVIAQALTNARKGGAL